MTGAKLQAVLQCIFFGGKNFIFVLISSLASFILQPQVSYEEASSTSSDKTQSSSHLSSRYTVSEEHQKAKEQFMEKERENARMEAKRRKLMEKRVRAQSYKISQ